MAEPFVGAGCQIGVDVTLGQNAVLHEGVQIGAGSRIGANVVLHAGTAVGPGVTIFDNAVLGRPPQGTRSLRRTTERLLPPLTIGAGSVIGAGAVLYAGTALGEEVLVGDLASIRENCSIGDLTIIGRGVTVNCRALIGKRVKIMDLAHVTADCLIEDDVFISLQVGMANDPTMGRRAEGQAAHYQGPIIRRRAAIGAGATLVPGVEIGEGAMVAAGSLVNRSIPAWTSAAGLPVRLLGDAPDRPAEHTTPAPAP
ncbi:MAG TPA: DapH/DapD/GlmU-related protein [Symbiobacteriaceae bacterium]|nr:DapH/DapD/GlmU-related protein [Symbiobacteriaceae bacterium]